MNGRTRQYNGSTSLVAIIRRGIRQLLTAAALGIGLAGCTPFKEYIHNGFKVGPNYGKPPAPVADQWIDKDDSRLKPDTEKLSKWWTVFNDPMLDGLICAASKQNLSLREAGFRILQARAELGISTSFIFPQSQSFDSGYTRKEVSLKVANRIATPQRFFDNWANGFGLSWEIDFWGKYRRLIESYTDKLDAAVEDYDAVMVMLLGDVAQAYTQYRVAEKRLALVRMNIELQKETLGIATSRFKGGLTTELDVDQATSTLAQTEALVPQLQIQMRQATNRLCILMGMPPVDLQPRLGAGGIPSAAPEVTVGIPCQVLMNRPDVRKAERQAAQACARIGSAEADLYPHISIVGNIGLAAQDLSHILNTQAWYGTIGPTFHWDILQYGRIVNHIALEDATFQEKAVAFQNTVLKANEEAENGIITYLKSHDRVEAYTRSVAADVKAVKVALAQYSAGTVDFNRVSLLEQNLVGQQDSLAQAQGEIALGLISVYKALGGGWEIRLSDCNQHLPAPAVASQPAAESIIKPAKPKPEELPKAREDNGNESMAKPNKDNLSQRLNQPSRDAEGPILPTLGETEVIQPQALPQRPLTPALFPLSKLE